MQGGQSPYLFTIKDTFKDTKVGQGFIYRGLCYKMGDLHNNTPLKKEWTEPINFSSWDWCKQTQTPKNSWLNTGRVTSLELLRRNSYTSGYPFGPPGILWKSTWVPNTTCHPPNLILLWYPGSKISAKLRSGRRRSSPSAFYLLTQHHENALPRYQNRLPKAPKKSTWVPNCRSQLGFVSANRRS